MDFLSLLDQMPDPEKKLTLEEEFEQEDQELEEELYIKSFEAAELQQEGEEYES